MKNEKKVPPTEVDSIDDVVYEEDKGAVLVKKLRKRLKTCEQEKKDYLDGWQRLKADNANSKKRNADMEEVLIHKTEKNILEGLLPVLDSFDMAFTGDAWENVDEIWRTGVEHIHSQLLNVLKTYEYVPYGASGEQFDPTLHEAVESIDGGTSGEIARVIRHGYIHKGSVVRPAQVVTYR